jgi:hypothetical protein
MLCKEFAHMSCVTFDSRGFDKDVVAGVA